jgi:IS605 OrfB family transposase
VNKNLQICAQRYLPPDRLLCRIAQIGYIKFEKLFSPGYSHRHCVDGSFEFSFENGSLYALQQQGEKRARVRGIPVIYVNPAYTSKHCYRCGGFGRRSRKHFKCPHCGYVAHPDLNPAFTIAADSLHHVTGDYLERGKLNSVHIGKKELSRQIRTHFFLRSRHRLSHVSTLVKTCLP